MNTKTNLRQRKSKRPVIILTALIIIVVLTVKGVMEFRGHYNNPSLLGEWVSEETGKTIKFTEKGIVNVDDLKTGQYIIESPGLIIYEVEGHTFEMTYDIKQRTLLLGLVGQEEKFEIKGI